MTEATQYQGLCGTAVQLRLDPSLKGAETTVVWWLLTGPWHPLWSQFIVSVIRLADIEGVPPANLHFVGATHELLVAALNPGDPPVVHSREALEAGGIGPLGGFLLPVDVCHQFTATDEEMAQLAGLCARACVEGALTPSTDDNRSAFRQQWLTACVRTLAHIRGEVHAP